MTIASGSMHGTAIANGYFRSISFRLHEEFTPAVQFGESAALALLTLTTE
jgi:hypothetical protein